MTEHLHHYMDRRIFDLDLGVEAVSLYILITSVLGDHVAPTGDIIASKWTSTPEILDRSLDELIDRQVIVKRIGPTDEPCYYPQPASLWR
jgi:hypothetical protein